MLLQLKKSRPGPLKRNARDRAGEIVRSYEFAPGGVQEVHDDDLLVVADDILSGVLVIVQMDNFQPVAATFDREKFAADVAKARAAAKAKTVGTESQPTKPKTKTPETLKAV